MDLVTKMKCPRNSPVTSAVIPQCSTRTFMKKRKRKRISARYFNSETWSRTSLPSLAAVKHFFCSNHKPLAVGCLFTLWNEAPNCHISCNGSIELRHSLAQGPAWNGRHRSLPVHQQCLSKVIETQPSNINENSWKFRTMAPTLPRFQSHGS